MRTKQPSGKVTNQLYLTMDNLADEYGNGSLRLTTRQTYQLHGVLKVDLKHVFSSVIRDMGSTLGACGDVNRNIMGPAAPFTTRPEYKHSEKVVDDIADLLSPQAGAYYDVWLDGEKFMSHTMEDPKVTECRNDNSHGTNFVGSAEPIYGTQFLPRKFKVSVTVPGDNSVDILADDVGVVVMTNPDTGELEGANIFVGGGMGRTHRNENTFPAIAQPLGYVPADDILYAVKAIVCVQRDYGRRDDRKQSRLKYLVHEWGLDKFRTVTEQYYGKKFEAFKELPPWENPDYMGWGEQGDGMLYYGVFVQNGRLKGGMKKALRTVIEKYNLSVRLTPHQNMVLCDIDAKAKDEISAFLTGNGVIDIEAIDTLDRNSMACPALPLCGLAIGEAERGMPEILRRMRVVMNKCGLSDDETFIVRMTGCPNGCARPYMAEMGLVADGANSYQVWLAGCPGQSRLAREFGSFKIQKLEEYFEPIFTMFAEKRTDANESFGDFTERVGFDAINEYSAAFGGEDKAAKAAPAAKKPAAPPAPKANGTVAAPAAAKANGTAPAGDKANGTAPAGAKANGTAPAAAKETVATPAVAEEVAAVPAAAKETVATPAVAKEVAAVPAAVKETVAATSPVKKTEEVSSKSMPLLPRVMIQEEAFATLQQEAEKRGLTLSELATEAILKHTSG